MFLKIVFYALTLFAIFWEYLVFLRHSIDQGDAISPARRKRKTFYIGFVMIHAGVILAVTLGLLNSIIGIISAVVLAGAAKLLQVLIFKNDDVDGKRESLKGKADIKLK